MFGLKGAISAGDPFAASAALHVLTQGGNAVDAVLTGAMVQCVVEPAWCGIGGDAFALVSTPGEGVAALNGSGLPPVSTLAALNGHETVPRFGPLSVSVPGFVGAWVALADRFATRSRTDLLAPAMAFASQGFPLDRSTAEAIARLRKALDDQARTGLGEWIESNGDNPGDRFVQPHLAETLTAIARRGAAGFYEGEVAERIAGWARTRGGALAVDDLGAHETTFVTPVSTTYRGYEVLTNPPVSLGAVLLEELALAESFDLPSLGINSAELIDLLVWCKRTSFAHLADLEDPRIGAAAYDGPLRERARSLASRYHLGAGAGALLEPDLVDDPDTTSIAAIDSNGRSAVLIHSLFNEFGSRELVPRTGILLNDRLANLSLASQRPNALKAGRRPLHTLHAYVVLQDGEFFVAGATPGGRGQVQTNLQVLCSVLDFGLDIQTALDLPRWVSGTPRTSPPDDRLLVESGMPDSTVESLRRLQHDVSETSSDDAPSPSDLFGACTVVGRDPATGTSTASADHRRRAVALGC